MDHAVDMNADDFYGCYMLVVQGTLPLYRRKVLSCNIFFALVTVI